MTAPPKVFIILDSPTRDKKKLTVFGKSKINESDKVLLPNKITAEAPASVKKNIPNVSSIDNFYPHSKTH